MVLDENYGQEIPANNVQGKKSYANFESFLHIASFEFPFLFFK